MRQKSSNIGKKSQKTLPTLPPYLYTEFRSLLLEALYSDKSFEAIYLAESFESKLSDGPSSVSDGDRRSAAINKWLDCEVRNRDTNVRIMHADETDVLFLNDRGFPVSAVDVIETCSKFIRQVLGDTVPWDELKGSFSGGASTSIRRGVGTIPKKYQRGTDITRNAFLHYARLTSETWGMPKDLNIVNGNVMFTVPKTSKIDRCACKEPDLNMYCQKAVGDYIRRRLKRVGVNLNDQTVNQELARIGSIDDTLSTIDLSAASDSVTTQLVIAMLPFEWSSLLCELRSPVTVIDGVEHINEMISSMGNAFTFELESLLFWAMLRACAFHTRTRGRISVYGDDLICPVGLRESVESVLEFFGFKLNRLKSFWDGPFRESCGKHWVIGREVTPFYVKSTPKSVSDWCLLLNSLRRWSEVTGQICDPRYYDLWALFAEVVVPKPLWGSKDLSRRDALVAPNITNIARIQHKQLKRSEAESELQLGAYLQWLNTTEGRSSDAMVTTNLFVEDGPEVIRRAKRDWALGIPVFPQEILG